MTEAAFTKMVLQLAKLHGFRVAHFRPARTARGWRTAVQGDGVGFPDLFLVHRRRKQAVAVELKVGQNKPTTEQLAWLMDMNIAGIPAFVWRPDDWGQIQTFLEGKP